MPRDVSCGLSFAHETQHFELARAEPSKRPSNRERRLDRRAEESQLALEDNVLHPGSQASCGHLRVEGAHEEDQGHYWPHGSHYLQGRCGVEIGRASCRERV